VRRAGSRGGARSPWLAAPLLVAIVVSAAAGAGAAWAAGPSALIPGSTEALWGVDSARPITPEFLDHIESDLGTPDFFGRYLAGKYAMSPSEVRIAFGRGIGILVLDNGFDMSDQTGYAKGQAAASLAVSAAAALGVPAGVAIFRDVEASSGIDTAFFRGYVDTIATSPYVAGFYGNPVTGAFGQAYCEAVARSPAYSSVMFFSSVFEPGRGPRSEAPAFAPAVPPCASDTVAWQYGEPGGDMAGGRCARTGPPCPHVDTDEALPTVPLWTQAGPSTAVSLINRSFEAGTAGWSAAGNTVLTVGTDGAKRGSSFAVMRASSTPGALFQASPIPSGAGMVWTFSAWVRADRGAGGTVRGSIVLFGLDHGTEAAATAFRVGRAWTLVSVRLALSASGTRLLAAVYLDTANHALDVDGARLVSRSGTPERPSHVVPSSPARPVKHS